MIAPLEAPAGGLAAPAFVACALVVGHAFPEVVVFVADAAALFVAFGRRWHPALSFAGALFLVAAGAFVVPCLAFAEVLPDLAGTFDLVSSSQYWERPVDSSVVDRSDGLHSGVRLHRREAPLPDSPVDYTVHLLDGQERRRVR